MLSEENSHFSNILTEN